MSGPGNLLACPRCLSPDYLGENVLGWRAIKTVRMAAGSLVTERGYDREVHDAERVSFFCSNQGCNVDEEILERRLVQLDVEGRAIFPQPAEQGRLA